MISDEAECIFQYFVQIQFVQKYNFALLSFMFWIFKLYNVKACYVDWAYSILRWNINLRKHLVL